MEYINLFGTPLFKVNESKPYPLNKIQIRELFIAHEGSFLTIAPITFSIYTLSDLGVLSNLIGSLSLANEHYSPPTE